MAPTSLALFSPSLDTTSYRTFLFLSSFPATPMAEKADSGEVGWSDDGCKYGFHLSLSLSSLFFSSSAFLTEEEILMGWGFRNPNG